MMDRGIFHFILLITLAITLPTCVVADMIVSQDMGKMGEQVEVIITCDRDCSDYDSVFLFLREAGQFSLVNSSPICSPDYTLNAIFDLTSVEAGEYTLLIAFEGVTPPINPNPTYPIIPLGMFSIGVFKVVNDNPTETPTELSTELPTALPTELPTELSTELSTELPTKPPTEVPTELPTEPPTKTPTPIPAELSPEFNADRTSGMAPLTVLLTDETAGNRPVMWSWHFDHQTVETNREFVSHTFESPGLYTVVMTAFNEEQKPFTKTKSKYIDVGSPIQASFSHGILEGKMPLEVWFIDTSKGSVDTWEWNFGPHGIQTTKNPRIIYDTPGEYPVALTVSSEKYGGEPATTSTILNISEQVDPVYASFIADPMVGEAPLGVQFSDTSLGYPDQWIWEFGDQTEPVYVQNPFHYFGSPGTYRVILTAMNSATNAQDQTSTHIRVSADGLPEASLEALEYVGIAPLTVSFNDKIDSAFEPASWLWNFGDGSSSFEQHPVHVYNEPGMYTATLEVKNKEGISQKMRVVHVIVT
jgi:PKD repeat protein